VIGRQWTSVEDEHGRRRLDKPGDYVRLEIEAALKRDIPVVPVLVDGAPMPGESDLPESLTDLAYRNAVELDDARWRDDVKRLIRSLKERETAQTSTSKTQTKKEAAARGTAPTRKKPQRGTPKGRASTGSARRSGALAPRIDFKKTLEHLDNLPKQDVSPLAGRVGEVVAGSVGWIFPGHALVRLAVNDINARLPGVQIDPKTGQRTTKFDPKLMLESTLQTLAGPTVESNHQIHVRIANVDVKAGQVTVSFVRYG
jgi:hypothetical protein